jgi:predicted metal-binding protein
MWYFYYSKSSQIIYPLEIAMHSITSRELTLDYDRVTGLCREGCANFGQSGGCPPIAPRFDSITSPAQKGILIYTKFLSLFKPPKVAQSNNIAIHWKFQDGILARFLDNVGWSMLGEFGGIFLSSGYCMGCPGKKCGFKTDSRSCHNPQRRTYSLEATGIDVVGSLWKLARENFYWYKKGVTDIPYMLKCIGFFPSNSLLIKENHLIDVLNNLNSCWLRIGSQSYLKEILNLQNWLATQYNDPWKPLSKP